MYLSSLTISLFVGAGVVFTFKDKSSLREIVQGVKQIKYWGGYTCTDKAYTKAYELLSNRSSGKLLKILLSQVVGVGWDGL